MKLLSWGANTHSQLGQGVMSEQCVLPTAILQQEPKLNLAHIISIDGGGGHTLVLDKDGKVFSCGWNNKGQLGFGVNTEVLTLKHVKSIDDYNITNICCGWESSFAITSSKNLLVWGSNSFGQLGLNRREIFLTSSPLMSPVGGVKSIAAGLRHTAIVTENGCLLVCGNGRKGQLGLTGGDGHALPEALDPHPIPHLNHIRNVACGQYHSIAVSEDGRIFAWGDNRHGQLGLDPTLHPSVYKPTEVHPFVNELLPSECKFLCGWTHTVLITDNGDVYNWGRNTYGQLGCSEHQRPVRWQPQKMGNVHRVKQMAVGSEHNLALLDTGEIVSWGWNEHGNCGTGSEVDITEPTHVEIDKRHKAVLVGTGGGHSFALVED